MVNYEDVAVVMPCRDEGEVVGSVVARVRAVSPDLEIIVVSDGSTDNTATAARDAGATVIEHTLPLGNGAAVLTGATRASRPYLVFLDGDGQHPPEAIPDLLAHLPDFDLVIAARTNRCDTDPVRKVGNWTLIRVAELLSGSRIDDLTSGFRAFNRSAFMRFAHIYPLGYSYPTTTTLAFLRGGYFVKFVPVNTICRRVTGNSGIRPLRHGLNFLEIILRVVMLFNPSKIFLPLALTSIGTGIVWGLTTIVLTGAIRSAAVILLLAGVMFFLNGLLADQLAQIRLNMNPGPPQRAELHADDKKEGSA
jgi:glycosyltransferase involved in cell wall biosynthesis